LLLILAFAIVGFGQLLRPGWAPYSPHSDLVAYHYNAKTALWQALQRHAGIPFWRSDQFAGLPGLTHPQDQFTHPFGALFFLWPPLVAAGPTIAFELVVGAFGFVALGKALGLRPATRAYLGVAGLFQFKAIAATYAGWLGVLPSIALLPWLFAATLYAVRKPGTRAILGIAAAGGLCLVGGQLQLTYYGVLFLAPFALVAMASHLAQRKTRRVRALAATLGAGTALALALAAHLLIPMAIDAPLLTRGSASYEFFLSGHALALRHLATFLWPDVLGTPLANSYPGGELWEDVGYVGLVPLALAGLGAWAGRRRAYPRFLAVSGLVALLLAFDSPVLRAVWHTVPGFALFRCPSRMLFVTSVCAIALSGFGLEFVRARLAKTHDRRSRLAFALVVLCVGGEGVYHARRYVTTARHEDVLPPSSLAARLAQDEEPFRVAPVGATTVNPGWAAPWGLELVSGFDSYNYKHYAQYFDLMVSGEVRDEAARVFATITKLTRLDLLNALNVKYLVTQAPIPAAMEARFPPVAHFTNEPRFVLYAGLQRGDLYLYSNDHARPRAWWATAVVGTKDSAALVDAVARGRVGLAAFVVGESAASPAAPSDRVTVEAVHPGFVKTRTEAVDARFLRWSEVWHPGWRATVDGNAVGVVRADLAEVGAWIPAGTHEVELVFVPPGWELGRALSWGGLLAFAALALLAAMRARRVPRTPAW
jgi:hypothetical protein